LNCPCLSVAGAEICPAVSFYSKGIITLKSGDESGPERKNGRAASWTAGNLLCYIICSYSISARNVEKCGLKRGNEMPANLTPEYKKAEEAFRQAKTVEEKIACLERMLVVIPKHKGTDHMQGDLRSGLAS